MGTALLTRGDRVDLEREPGASYEIVHISQEKAWVRPVEKGAPRIVSVRDLLLVSPRQSCKSGAH